MVGLCLVACAARADGVLAAAVGSSVDVEDGFDFEPGVSFRRSLAEPVPFFPLEIEVGPSSSVTIRVSSPPSSARTCSSVLSHVAVDFPDRAVVIADSWFDEARSPPPDFGDKAPLRAVSCGVMTALAAGVPGLDLGEATVLLIRAVVSALAGPPDGVL